MIAVIFRLFRWYWLILLVIRGLIAVVRYVGRRRLRRKIVGVEA